VGDAIASVATATADGPNVVSRLDEFEGAGTDTSSQVGRGSGSALPVDAKEEILPVEAESVRAPEVVRKAPSSPMLSEVGVPQSDEGVRAVPQGDTLEPIDEEDVYAYEEGMVYMQGSWIPMAPSLGFIDPGHPVRWIACKVMLSEGWLGFIALCIVISSAMLTWEHPDMDADEKDIVLYIEVACIAVFTVELLIKVIALGFILHSGACFARVGNCLDLLVIACSAIALPYDSTLSIIKLARIVRILRPLRMITRSKALHAVMHTLLSSMSGLVTYWLISVVVIISFAVMGIVIFKDRSGSPYCDDHSKKTLSACTGYWGNDWGSGPQAVLVNWRVTRTSFDNIWQSTLTLFQVTLLEDWYAVAYYYTKHPDGHDAEMIFFILWICISSFFLMHLVIAVIWGNHCLVKIKRRYWDLVLPPLHHRILKEQPLKRRDLNPSTFGAVQQTCKSVYESRATQLVVCLVLLFNAVVLSINHYGLSRSAAEVIWASNLACSAFFVAEWGFKLLGVGGAGLWSTGWERFEFLFVLVALVDVIISAVEGHDRSVGVVVLQSLKMLRLAQWLRLVGFASSIEALVSALSHSLRMLGVVLMVFVMMLYMWAVAGVQLFGTIQHTTRPHGLSNYNNFDNFGSAILVLLRVSLGAHWAELMYDCSEATSNAAGLYYITFLLFVKVVFLALFSVAVTEGIQSVVDISKASLPITKHDFVHFIHVWSLHDPHASAFVPVSRLPALLGAIPPPLGIRPSDPKMQFVQGVDITVAKSLAVLPRLLLPVHSVDHLGAELAQQVRQYSGAPTEKLIQFHELLEALCLFSQGGDISVLEATAMGILQDDVTGREREILLQGRNLTRLLGVISTIAFPEICQCLCAWRSSMAATSSQKRCQVQMIEQDAIASGNYIADLQELDNMPEKEV